MGVHDDSVSKGPAWNKAFHIKTARGPYGIQDFGEVVGLSRTTILYYESLGLISPERAGDSGRREFDSRDIFMLLGATILKNVGIPPKELPERLANEPFSCGKFQEYEQSLEQRIRYQQAQVGALKRLSRLKSDDGTFWVGDVERFLIRFDNAESGFHGYPADEVLDRLLEHMPIASMGCEYRGSFLDGDFSVRAGRTVAQKDACLVGPLPQDMATIGGCRCVCAVCHFPNPYSREDERILWELRASLKPYLAERCLRPCGPAFNPYSLYSDEGLYIPFCLPVEKAGAETNDGVRGEG